MQVRATRAAAAATTATSRLDTQSFGYSFESDAGGRKSWACVPDALDAAMVSTHVGELIIVQWQDTSGLSHQVTIALTNGLAEAPSFAAVRRRSL